MRFGPVKRDDALGSVLAHSLVAGKVRLKKGRVLSADDLATLASAQVEQVIVARLEADDVGEDDAAERLADVLVADGLRAGKAATGRVNLYATRNGLFLADKTLVDQLNLVHPSITLATLADHTQVAAGDMVATVKIIPLAVAGDHLNRAMQAISAPGILVLRLFESRVVGLVATQLPSLKPSVMDKTARLLQERLNASGSHILPELRVPHDAVAVGEAILSLVDRCDLVIAFGASAIVDPLDVLPAGILHAGGHVDQVGMPVDPGNLLVLGHVGKVPVIGAPGCARSPRENGFDWVLARILTGETPAPEMIMQMGVGGLLKEIPGRPQPRLASEQVSKGKLPVDIVVLAAGRASRMGAGKTAGGLDKEGQLPAPHKLLAEFAGVPLIRKSVETARCAGKVHVITGYRSHDMKAALEGLDVAIVHNPDFDEGMASSLRCGVSVMGPEVAGILVMLADMPGISAAHLRTMLDTFNQAGAKVIVRAASGALRGNPVILPRETFEALSRLEGDVGARQVIASAGLPIIDVDIGDAALLDVDTQQAVLDAGGILKN